MKLRELVAETELAAARGSEEVEVISIANDSKQVVAGSLFIAIKGIAQDGHDFLPQAVARGASALLVEDASRVPSEFSGAVTVVADGRAALNRLAGRFFGDPGRKLFCVGVTGTDGKTTVTHMAEAVLAAAGIPTAVIGTVDHHFGAHRWPGDTTPPPLVMQARLAEFLGLGARAVALEATSQGLSQARVNGVPFDVAVFTNLTRDHLDYHRTLDGYFEAKQRLFTEALASSPKRDCFAIINVDTPYGSRLRVPSRATRWTYGRVGSGADLEVETLATSLAGSVFRLRAWGKEAELRLPMLGAFNGENALAAIAIGVAAGGDFFAAVEALGRFSGVPGRVQRVVHAGDKTVFIDYAHSPDAFEKVLGTVRAALQRERSGGRLLTLFGCGGDRDRGKRPLMLESALRHSDRVIITTDNPRSEDPEAIAAEMLAGATSAQDRARVTVELDRTRAIELALESTTDADVVMLLGKGHEDYQLVGNERRAHSDYAVAAAKLGAGG